MMFNTFFVLLHKLQIKNFSVFVYLNNFRSTKQPTALSHMNGSKRSAVSRAKKKTRNLKLQRLYCPCSYVPLRMLAEVEGTTFLAEHIQCLLELDLLYIKLSTKLLGTMS